MKRSVVPGETRKITNRTNEFKKRDFFYRLKERIFFISFFLSFETIFVFYRWLHRKEDFHLLSFVFPFIKFTWMKQQRQQGWNSRLRWNLQLTDIWYIEVVARVAATQISPRVIVQDASSRSTLRTIRTQSHILHIVLDPEFRLYALCMPAACFGKSYTYEIFVCRSEDINEYE